MSLITSDSDIAVKQANKLIESIYRMDVNEHKLLLLATKKVNEMELRNEPFNERTKITITNSEFAKQYGISRASAFEILIEAKKSIYDREFEYLHQDDKGVITPMKSRWLQSRGVDKAKSEVSFMFASAVIPLIYLVKSEYTLLDLHEIGQLKSKYAVRLYKYLMRWVNAPYRNKITYSDLREMFGLGAEEYPELCDFRKRVLTIAVKQVKAGTGFKDLTVSNHKTGVKVTGFSFHYTKYDNNLIKGPKRVVESIDPTVSDTSSDYFVYRMTDEQIKAFAPKIALKASTGETGFSSIGAMVGPGKNKDDLAKLIEADFMSGSFEPYYASLKLLGFKPNKFNKTPVASSTSENKAIVMGSHGHDIDTGLESTFKLPDSHYEIYVKKGGKLSKDQILEAAMAENRPPIKIMLDNGINILAS